VLCYIVLYYIILHSYVICVIYLDPQSILLYMQQGRQRSIPYLIIMFDVSIHKLNS
jgi:hypothetical protein